MKNVIEQVIKAKLILVPKGDDSKPCISAFVEATGVQVPDFEGRELEASVAGRTFLKVKGRDIPGLIAAGFGDVGLTGSDSCEDYLAVDTGVDYKPIGRQMCRFALLAPVDRADTMRKQVELNDGSLTAATSFPNLLNKCASEQGLKVSPTEAVVSGSVEIMPRLLEVSLVADIVSSGATARANGLVEVKNLFDAYPAIITRSVASVARTRRVSWADVEKIDATLALRGLQLNDKSTNSYTLGLMRDSNKAGKKAGEEFSEVSMAIFGDGSVKDCEGEIADLIYAQLVAGYSRNKLVKLDNILRILIERNQTEVQA